MAVLNFRDPKTGQWTSMYALQGPEGPKGEKGPKGDKGDTGGIQDVAQSVTKGYITVTKADGTKKEVVVGAAGDFLPLRGGTVTGQLYIAFNQSVGLDQSGSLIIGDKTNYNIGINGSAIMARKNGAASTLYLNNDGGLIQIGSGGIVNNGDETVKGTLTVNKNITTKSAFIGPNISSSWIHISHNGALRITTKPTSRSAMAICSLPSHNGSWAVATLYGTDSLYFVYGSDANYSAGTNNTTNITFGNGGQVYGAVWNDYAEYRQASIKEPGRCVVEKGDDTLELSTARLLPGANIVSDTFGFAIGETKDCATPIAVSGRVLAYPYEPRDQFKAGDTVCSGPNGTVSIMTREEIKEYPERIIGTVSSVPTYEKWGSGNVLVNGRVWIKVR